MKFLILFLISFQVFAATPIDLVGKEKANKLDTIYKQIDGYCDNTGHHADLIAECKKAKGYILGQYAGAILKLVDKKILEGKQKADADYAELLCVQRLQEYFTEKGYPFNGSENCEQLNQALLVHEPPQE